MIHIDDRKLKTVYFEEVTELLDTLNEKLLALEQSSDDRDTINEIFRITHSIKSESSLVGYNNIAKIAHKMEDIFERVRRGVLNVDLEIMNDLFAAYDRIIELIKTVQNGIDEETINITDVIVRLAKILNEEAEIESTDLTQKKDIYKESENYQIKIEKRILKEINIDFNDNEKNQIEDGLEKGESLYYLIFNLFKDCQMCYPRAYLLYNNLISLGTIIRTNPDIMIEADDKKFISFELFILTTKSEDEVIKHSEIDQVENIFLNKIELSALKNKGLDLSNLPELTNIILSKEEIEEAEIIEKEWNQQLESNLKQDKKKKDFIEDLTKDINEESKKAVIKEGLERSELSQKDNILKKQTIRVDTDRLDSLMNLVGELIINQSRFSQVLTNITDNKSVQEIKTEIEDATNELERISDQMQLGMMQVRMVPIGTVFSKFPRMVRDLANTLHKNVSLYIIGENTEIDRAIVELITEPLTHLIRNSIDHGIEAPEERERKGKAREGVIILKAYQQGSSIYIEVNDDGKGISLETVKNKAIEKNLISEMQASSMSRNEIMNLIFEPGFSTKDEITNVSGRGVGMDVVKSQILKLRGSVNVETNFGQGTNITIVLPLTLTIVEALLVNVSKNIFAIPIDVVEETLIIDKKELKDFDVYKVYNLRDETLAVLNLAELVGLKSTGKDAEIFVVVVSYEKRRIGLIVDELIGNQDIVIKALDESLKTLDGIAGATVLGDGKIALILHINNLVKAREKEINKIVEKVVGKYEFYEAEEKGYDKIFDELNKPEFRDSIIKSTKDNSLAKKDYIEVSNELEFEDGKNESQKAETNLAEDNDNYLSDAIKKDDDEDIIEDLEELIDELEEIKE